MVGSITLIWLDLIEYPLTDDLATHASVAIGTANLLASFFNWYLFRHIDHRDNTDLNRMGEPVGEKNRSKGKVSKA